MTSPTKRSGRPQGPTGNRDRILAIARQHFAHRGFRGATLRAIAEEAGLDVALLAHYFGNKDGLLAATLQLPPGAAETFGAAVTGPLATQGARLTRAYFSMWEDQATREALLVLVRTALGSEAGTARMSELLAQHIGNLQRTAVLVNRTTGFTLAMSHLLGTALARHVLRVPGLTALDLEQLVATVSPMIQAYLERADT
ncbi:TetR/AcrR family transcriptional regulator [Massilia arenosa]|uniref:TetR/AcrR family transcriptional regulator n=1 Tax=Zemynaea arenosa TaxID=2561931 RepID=A0A4Y9SBN2_9BURK|nr:TetR/AcrR family transcriptional regulator [Massilia arenosa]TFW19631.1 TetR/AcrR family transcriptional regulator [Massilia arenosa]